MGDKAQSSEDLLESVRLVIAIDFSLSNAAKSRVQNWGRSLHSIGDSGGEIYESPYRRALVYLLKGLPYDKTPSTVELLNFSDQINERAVLTGNKYEILEQGLKLYDEWVCAFEKRLSANSTDNSLGTALAPIIMRGIQTVYETREKTALIVFTDGGISDPCAEAHAVREASLHPLCISIVGITCNSEHPKLIQSFDEFYTMDDNLFNRVFDNLNFTPFQYCLGSEYYYPGISPAVTSANSLIHRQQVVDTFINAVTDEFKAQFEEIEELKYFERDMDMFEKIFSRIDCNSETMSGDAQDAQLAELAEQIADRGDDE